MLPGGRFARVGEPDSGSSIFKSAFMPEKALFLLPYEDDHGLGSDHTFTQSEQDAMEAVARYMAEAEYVPALVLASRTKRAREAIDILTATLGREPAVFLERALQYCTVQDLMERLRCVSNFIPSVLLIAGRRTLEALAVQLSRGDGPSSVQAARARMMTDFSGSAFAVLTLAVESWGALMPNSGLLEAYIRPGDLLPQEL